MDRDNVFMGVLEFKETFVVFHSKVCKAVCEFVLFCFFCLFYSRLCFHIHRSSVASYLEQGNVKSQFTVFTRRRRNVIPPGSWDVVRSQGRAPPAGRPEAPQAPWTGPDRFCCFFTSAGKNKSCSQLQQLSLSDMISLNNKAWFQICL